MSSRTIFLLVNGILSTAENLLGSNQFHLIESLLYDILASHSNCDDWDHMMSHSLAVLIVVPIFYICCLYQFLLTTYNSHLCSKISILCVPLNLWISASVCFLFSISAFILQFQVSLSTSQ